MTAAGISTTVWPDLAVRQGKDAFESVLARTGKMEEKEWRALQGTV